MGKSEQGVSNERYQIIPRVLIFLFNEINEVLLIKGSAIKKIWPNLWNGLGGHVEPGESILRAAKRELKEESGLSTDKLLYCGQVIVNLDRTPGIGINIFKTNIFQGEIRSSDEGNLEWFSLEDALRLSLVQDLYTLLPKVAQFNQGDDPFFAVYSYNFEDQLIISFD